MIRRPPRSPLFPYTPPFRSRDSCGRDGDDGFVRKRSRSLPGRQGHQNRRRRELGGSAEHVAGHRSEEHTSELQSRQYLVCRLLLEKKKEKISDNQQNTRYYI